MSAVLTTSPAAWTFMQILQVLLKQTQCSIIDYPASLVKESIDSGHLQCSRSFDVHESSLQVTPERTLDLTWPELHLLYL